MSDSTRVMADMCVATCWQQTFLSVGHVVPAEHACNTDYMLGKHGPTPPSPENAAFVREHVGQHIDALLNLSRGDLALPKRLLRLYHSSLVTLAEAAEDRSLCEQATECCLHLSGGRVDETTPWNVPLALAAWCERDGRQQEAIRLYELTMDALKNAFPHGRADTIVFRRASLQADVEDDVEAAIITLGRFHADFGGQSASENPARALARQAGEQWASQLGYSSLAAAVAELVG